MCQMIARIDADHDAGLYRTRTFGLDYVRFIARCPPESPLPLLKIAFKCCMVNLWFYNINLNVIILLFDVSVATIETVLF